MSHLAIFAAFQITARLVAIVPIAAQTARAVVLTLSGAPRRTESIASRIAAAFSKIKKSGVSQILAITEIITPIIVSVRLPAHLLTSF
jgi:hypothetical protein